MMGLKLGIIGLSPGNGHPYSWSAICNGYDAEKMAGCEFPIIPMYLAEQEWPAARLPEVRVTHVWTQNRSLSERIAQAAQIENIVDQFQDMIGHIDGLLLARDDAKNHLLFAEPFLRAGLPVFIDKPIALTRKAFDALYEFERYPGQIFSCSALRFSNEMSLSDADHEQLGSLRMVTAITPKSWDTYAIHIIDPLVRLLGLGMPPSKKFARTVGEDGRIIGLAWGEKIDVVLTALGSGVAGPLQLRVHGDSGWRDLVFRDSFTAFRNVLAEFVTGIKERSVKTPPNFNRRAVEILEMGRGGESS